MPLRTEYMTLDELEKHVHPENPKDHDIPGIISSFDRFGMATAITVCDRTDFIAAGHGRLEALQLMKAQGDKPPANVEVLKTGEWTAPVQRGWASADDEELLAYVISDNRHTELGGWKNNLTHLLERLAGSKGLIGTGYTGADLKDMLAAMKATGSDPSNGSLLALADIAIEEPTHQVKMGEIYRINARHTLVVVDVMSGWKVWAKYLEGEALFVPYPGPYAAISQRADLKPMVLVQPDPYLAGHLLDKFAAMNAEELIVKVK